MSLNKQETSADDPFASFRDYVADKVEGYSFAKAVRVARDLDRLDFRVVAGIMRASQGSDPNSILAIGTISAREASSGVFVDALRLSGVPAPAFYLPERENRVYNRMGLPMLGTTEEGLSLLGTLREGIESADFNSVTTDRYASLISDPTNLVGIFLQE